VVSYFPKPSKLIGEAIDYERAISVALQVLADSLNDSPLEVPRQGSGGRGKGRLYEKMSMW